MQTTRSWAISRMPLRAIPIAVLIAAAAAFGAEDTLVDASFNSQDGSPLGGISSGSAAPPSGAISYCADDLPLEVMIHAQTTTGTGAEYATVELVIDGAVIATDTLNMAGVVYVSVDQPVVSATSGDTHTVEARLVADDDFDGSTTSGSLQVVDCEGGGSDAEIGPFRIPKELRRIEDEAYVVVPLQEAIDLIWLTRDKIDEMNRRGELKADLRILLPENVVHAMERIVNENPALQRELGR